MKEGISRRAFFGGVATLAASSVLATGCSAAIPAEESESSPKPDTTERANANTSTNDGQMTTEEAIAALNDEPKITEDLVLDDGTVIPALYLSVRNRLNRLGNGIGAVEDTSKNVWGFVMRVFSEEEAEYYLDMPLTKDFTATEMAVKSGRDESKCLEVCEALASRGLLYRTRRSGIASFRLIPQINGIWEYSIKEWGMNGIEDAEYLGLHWGQYTAEYSASVHDSDTPPYFRSLPVSKDIVGNERVMSPYDDFEAIIRRHTVIAQGDCVCRANNKIIGESCDHPTQTEILTGEEAEYYIENGIGWPISQDEALEVLRNAIDEGLVIQTAFSKASEIFCCCAGDCCKMLGGIKAVGSSEVMQYYSHYTLEHEKDSCIKCGICASRCHLEAISYDDEGYPTTALSCVRCGQCAVTCPGGARTLALIEDYPELPDTIVATDLHKAVTRMKRGHIIDYVPGA